MNYPIKYWTQRIHYWFGTFSCLCLAGGVGALAILGGERFVGGCFYLICCFIVYHRVLRVTIPAYSMIVRDGIVQELCMDRERCMAGDPRIRGVRIVELGQDEMFEHAYDVSIVLPAQGYRLYVCNVWVTVGHIMHLDAWQRFYETFVIGRRDGTTGLEDMLTDAAKKVERMQLAAHTEEAVRNTVLSTVVNLVNEKLKSIGLHVADADCTCTISTTATFPAQERNK